MEIFYFIVIYLAFFLLTNYLNKLVKADLFFIKKFKIATKKRIALFGACTSAIIYISLLFIAEMLLWKVSSYVFSSVSVAITVGLITNINKQLMNTNKKSSKKRKGSRTNI